MLLTCSIAIAGAWQKVDIKQTQIINIMETAKNDVLAISEVVDVYFNAIYNGDAELLRSTFNEGALLFGDIKGVPYAKTLDEYIDGVKNRQSPKDSGKPFKGEIISVDVINSIAIAKASVQMYDFVYNDLLSFHKIDNQWLIVNKMLTDTSK